MVVLPLWMGETGLDSPLTGILLSLMMFTPLVSALVVSFFVTLDLARFCGYLSRFATRRNYSPLTDPRTNRILSDCLESSLKPEHFDVHDGSKYPYKSRLGLDTAL